mmetsp:Transcript_4191/g.13091  ORF Transcript_4191/g.13091 Transcript_4191/m.13091 type:complete len:226 (-) Transcript_4191:433-1110(-)
MGPSEKGSRHGGALSPRGAGGGTALRADGGTGSAGRWRLVGRSVEPAERGGEKWVLARVCDAEAVLWVGLERLREQVPKVLRARPVVVVASLPQHFEGVAVVRRFAAEDAAVDDGRGRIDVDGAAVLADALLRRPVGRRTRFVGRSGARAGDEDGLRKVGEDERGRAALGERGDEEVTGLQIAVRDGRCRERGERGEDARARVRRLGHVEAPFGPRRRSALEDVE